MVKTTDGRTTTLTVRLCGDGTGFLELEQRFEGKEGYREATCKLLARRPIGGGEPVWVARDAYGEHEDSDGADALFGAISNARAPALVLELLALLARSRDLPDAEAIGSATTSSPPPALSALARAALVRLVTEGYHVSAEASTTRPALDELAAAGLVTSERALADTFVTFRINDAGLELAREIGS